MMVLNNDDKEWIRSMIREEHSASALATRELIFKEAIPGHEKGCRNWFAIKITVGVLAVVMAFLGVGNIWGLTTLINAVNAARITATASAAGAHSDADTAHNDTKTASTPNDPAKVK